MFWIFVNGLVGIWKRGAVWTVVGALDAFSARLSVVLPSNDSDFAPKRKGRALDIAGELSQYIGFLFEQVKPDWTLRSRRWPER